jgi:hypothetical protein
MKSSAFLAFGVLAAASICLSVQAQVVAYDNGDLYPGNPDHNWPAFNGGYGYNLWTTVGGISGGGTFMEGVGVNNRQVEGNYSFAVFAGSGGFAISRPLTNSLVTAEFDILTRFDLAGSGPNLINLRAGNDTGGFGNGELLSFGIVNGNTLSYTDGAGFHLLPSGEARGSVWAWDVVFNAGSGAYSASVTNLGGGFASFFNGNLEANGTSVGSFAVLNSSTGNNQNEIFDIPQFTLIPEPSTLSLAWVGLAVLSCLRRRRR